MIGLRLLLAAIFGVIATYTVVTIINHGWNLFPVFFGDIATMTWRGQFNVDFTSFLMLSALWVAWRHHFSLQGICLAILAFFGGGLILTVYLLVVSFSEQANLATVLLGKARARRACQSHP